MAVVVGPANLLQSPVLQLSDCQFVPQNSPSLNFHFSSFLTSTLLIFFHGSVVSFCQRRWTQKSRTERGWKTMKIDEEKADKLTEWFTTMRREPMESGCWGKSDALGKWFERRALFTQSFRIELEWRNGGEIWETKRLPPLPYSMAVFLSLPLGSSIHTNCGRKLTTFVLWHSVYSNPPLSHSCLCSALSLSPSHSISCDLRPTKTPSPAAAVSTQPQLPRNQ